MGRSDACISRWAGLVPGSLEAGLEPAVPGVGQVLESVVMGPGPMWMDLDPGSMGWPHAEIALDMHAEAIEAGLKPGYAGASLEARSVGADLALGWTEAWVHGRCLGPGAAGTDLGSSLPGLACSYHKLGAWVHRSCSGG